MSVGLDQVDPQQRRQRERDDHRVGHRRPVAVLVAVVDEQHHASDQERVEGQVERVGDRRERHRGLEDPFVVVGDHVADDEHGPARQRADTTAAGRHPGDPAAPTISATTAAPATRSKTRPLPEPAGPLDRWASAYPLVSSAIATRYDEPGVVSQPGGPRHRACAAPAPVARALIRVHPRLPRSRGEECSAAPARRALSSSSSLRARPCRRAGASPIRPPAARWSVAAHTPDLQGH